MNKMIEINQKLITIDVDYRDIISDKKYIIPKHYNEIIQVAQNIAKEHNILIGHPTYTTQVLETGYSTPKR